MFQSGEMWHFYVGGRCIQYFSQSSNLRPPDADAVYWCILTRCVYPIEPGLYPHLLIIYWIYPIEAGLYPHLFVLRLHPSLFIQPCASQSKVQKNCNPDCTLYNVQCKYNYRNINNLNQYNQNLSEDTNLIFNFNTINRIKYLSYIWVWKIQIQMPTCVCWKRHFCLYIH